MHDYFGGLTGWDLEGFHRGGDTELWRRLGAFLCTVTDDQRGELHGTRFAVWAPNAREVRVIGDWNDWSPDADPMRRIPGSGCWGCFVEGIGEGALYKYAVLGADGRWSERADPMARRAEGPPNTASIVAVDNYPWHDQGWMGARVHGRLWREPMSIYECHLGSWKPGRTYHELATELVDYVRRQGFTHIEFMPLTQHPFTGSWGYQVTGYYAPMSKFGTPDDLRFLIDRFHQAGIGVIMDWVPGHFPKDSWALGRFDGTALYEHADPRLGEHPDWGTYIFNFGRNEVKSFLVSNALYWLSEFHVDGLRVDAVASMLYLDYSREEGQWVPNRYGGNENLDAIDFLRYVNRHLYEREPGCVMIAEESTSFPGVTKPVDQGGLGFGFKWNMGWMNDTLAYLEHEPIHRQYHHNNMTFAMVYQYSENFILPISHDEVVHGKGSMLGKVPGDDWQKFATLRAYYAFMWSHPGKQLLFQGCEIGQRGEFNERQGVDWLAQPHWGHHGLQTLVRDLNRIYRTTSALWELDAQPIGFRWINADDAAANVYSFLRFDEAGNAVACVVNFSPVPHGAYRIGLPYPGEWAEVLNTDSDTYDGTGQWGNLGQVETEPIAGNGLPHSATVVVPPLGAVWFTHPAPPPTVG